MSGGIAIDVIDEEGEGGNHEQVESEMPERCEQVALEAVWRDCGADSTDGEIEGRDRDGGIVVGTILLSGGDHDDGGWGGG